MLEQEDAFKFHFREGRRIMILSVSSSPALVSGLDFSAMISPVVHIGAIAVSFLFVVMMLNIQIAEIHEEVLRYLPVSGLIGLILWWEMFFICDNETIPLLPTHGKTTSLRYTVHAGKVRSWTNLETLGNLLYTYYSVWFLVPSLILLVAMIGAIVLTMHRTTRVKRQDVFRRNALDSRRTIMRRTTDQIDISLTPPGRPCLRPGEGRAAMSLSLMTLIVGLPPPSFVKQ
ncbi:NADH-ubiquinone oxidoreductase chain 6 [Platanthera zijinensis]|uniref:NADH-ubiquinone oxidoreductase chain 6 n=1 Tax=Platanthera zijinensis TaxID=2320716 RepID=A0AAP0BI69_9ASPA